MIEPEKTAQRIKQLMNERNMTTQQFADLIGVQRSGLSHVFTGRNKPGLELIVRIVEKIPEVSYEYLISGKESENGFREEGKVKSDTDTDTNVTESMHDAHKNDTNVSNDDPDKQEKGSELKTESKKNNTDAPQDKELIKVILLYSDGSFDAFNQ